MASDSPSAVSGSTSTSPSLLLRVVARDDAAWQMLVSLYGPMVYRWARKAGLQAHDTLDVVQNVFLAVASDIGRFRRSRPEDSFRGWLWTICRHKVLDHFRDRQHQNIAVGGSTAHRQLQQATASPDPDTDEANSEMCRMRHRALALLRGHFEAHVWQAFLRTAVHGDHPADVAKDLGVSVSTVYRARFRVQKRLRSELAGL